MKQHAFSKNLVGPLSACLPVCLPVCLFVCLSVCLSVCLPVCLYISVIFVEGRLTQLRPSAFCD